GFCDARAMAARTAKHLGSKPEKVLVASTGVIGRAMPMANVTAGIDSAAPGLNTKSDHRVVEAISTTDTRYKSAVVQIRLGGKNVTVAGIVKGSGMIAPSLATMIGVITTDAAVAPALLYKLLRQAVRTSFNAVTVDSDQSTSDIVAIFASGCAGAKEVKDGTAECKKFFAAVQEVCDALAFSIAADGEGATRVIEISVTGAHNDKEAQMAAKSVADSPLVKTAVHGADPNWGRIAMALGKSAAKVKAEKLIIKIGGTKIFAKGTGCKCDLKKISEMMKQNVVKIDCELGQGKGKFTALTCDLSREYISINADYTT
ncbi:MAG TPA: bifunctional glutamate N-acetyltransferase/amino-acid acetyltransferase ArgJ, partial [Phycisphaerae bacterium]|nr:bifunctional glutamate N-acetyltransferase/amino-acid acetyltransferase ArgJ [Phycisphaerae bacterium]